MLTADVGGTTYFFEKAGVNFVNGKYYEITVKMAEAAKYTDLSTKTSDYTASDGEVLTGKMGDTYAQLIIPNNATVTLLNAEIDYDSWNNAIQCQGTATIIPKGTNVIKSSNGGGIQNGGTGTTLILKGTGTLNVKASNAAIGNSSNYDGTGDIEIQGGTYNLEGYDGIGSYNYACGNITISGGTINATKIQRTAIGCDHDATCGNILISGGTVVTSTTGIISSSIGASQNGTCGTITISGGTVTADAGSADAAAIGCGDGGECGAITISGGTVTAICGTSDLENPRPAIGKREYNGTCPSMTITTDITSLTMTNSNGFVTGIVSDFIRATEVYANAAEITTLLSTSVTDATITTGMTVAGFATDYNSTTKTWTVSK
jgi:hypothetical protein